MPRNDAQGDACAADQRRPRAALARRINDTQGGARAAGAAFALPWAYVRTTLRAYGLGGSLIGTVSIFCPQRKWRNKMAQSLARVSIQCVFSTKNREPLLCDPALRTDLYAYMASVLRDKVDSPSIAINGVEDHVHVLLILSRRFPIMKVIEQLKSNASRWLKNQPNGVNNFSWQNGYGAFSVSESNIPQVKRYIANQVEHHRQMSFKDEFRELCRKHQLNLDERYAWN